MCTLTCQKLKLTQVYRLLGGKANRTDMLVPGPSPAQNTTKVVNATWWHTCNYQVASNVRRVEAVGRVS